MRKGTRRATQPDSRPCSKTRGRKKTLFSHILVPLDGSSLAEKVLPHVVTLARSFNPRLTLFRAVGEDSAARQSIVDPVNWQMVRSQAQAHLDEVAGRLQDVGLESEPVVWEGPAAERIIDYTREQDVALVVLSSHGRSGLSEWNINSVVQKVILRAYCPVLIIRAYRPVPDELTGLQYRRLMVPLDGSKRAEIVLPYVTTLARSQDATLLLARVVAEPEIPRRESLVEEQQELIDRLLALKTGEAKDYLDGLTSRLSVATEQHLLVEADVAAELHELAEEQNVDLVALSAHGWSGRAKWPYGTVALSFIAYGTTPLLIVQDIPREQAEVTKAEEAVQERKGH
jgi:nucleotide-binding universal stress UspA family protein